MCVCLGVGVTGQAVLSTNAMDPAGFVDGVNNPLTFIYASSPTRGLEQVLTVWPSVYTRLGGARTQPRLLVYYGFTAGFERHARKVHPNYDEWRAHMDALLQADGVEYIGLVPPAELARGYAEAGFALYPTSYPETSCVAMMKAMVRVVARWLVLQALNCSAAALVACVHACGVAAGNGRHPHLQPPPIICVARANAPVRLGAAGA